MKHTFDTPKYRIELIYRRQHLEIVATCKESGRYSSVTNLNCIIGEIIHHILPDLEVEESYVSVDDELDWKCLKYYALKLLTNDDWRNNVLEPALDEDRAEGEWEAGRDD